MDDHHYDDDYHAIKPEIYIGKAEIKVEDDIEMIDSTQENPFAEKKYGKEQKNVCLICDTGFETKMSLLMHFASEHDMKYECSDCLKVIYKRLLTTRPLEDGEFQGFTLFFACLQIGP